jgi:RNA polymerase sigma-70 factor, ECF subfamily
MTQWRVRPDAPERRDERTTMLGTRFAPVLAAARTGDDRAWRDLHDDLAGPLFGYLRGRGSPEPEDEVGETFLDVARSLSGFSGDEDGFRRWVFTIAHRRSVDALRRRGRRPVRPLPTEDLAVLADAVSRGVQEVDRVVDRVADRELLASLLERLSDEQREVIVLRFVADLDTATVGALTGRTPEAVAAMTLRALRRLREVIAHGDPAASSSRSPER